MFWFNELIFNFIPIFFIFIIGMFIFTIVKGITTWNKNNHSPRLSVFSKIVSKRSDVDVHHHTNAQGPNGGVGFHSSTSTSYYVTFEVESGDRMEFLVSGKEYGSLAEGDVGMLTFQGTRYLDFERELD